MNKRAVGLIVGLLIVIVGFVVVPQMRKSAINVQTKTITVGVILPLTGNLSVLGQNEASLLRASIEVINKYRIDRPPLELRIEDAASDAKKAATVANLFAAQKMPIVMASTTPLAGPIIPICEQNEQVVVIHSMTESLLENTHFAMRIYPGIGDEVRAISGWLETLPEKSSLFALRLDTEWSAKWIEIFSSTVSSVSMHDETYTMADPNIRNALAKLRDSRATHILLLGYGQEYPTLLKQIREAGITLPVIGNIGFVYAGTRESAMKMGDLNLLAGCVFPSLGCDTNSPNYRALQAVYDREGKGSIMEEPGALYFFDSLLLLANAIDDVGVTPDRIRNQIFAKQNPFRGITGQITFSEDGNCRTHLSMAQYDGNGQIIPLPTN